MTVSYSLESKFGSGFKPLLMRWKGSIFKLVWPDLLVFLSFYFSISGIYRFVLDSDQRRLFIKISIYCEKYGTLIPVSFVLGFYVSLVIGRWWAQYKLIPWIDTVAMWVNTSIKGTEENERMLRRTIVRYVCLSITQCFTMISRQAKRRFPTLDHLVAAGLVLESEKHELENIIAGLPKYQNHWVPLVWVTTLVTQARADGKIVSDTFVKSLTDEIHKIKDNCNLLLCFDRIRVPLVYAQVVTLAVYSYFLSCLMGRQWMHIESDGDDDNKSRAKPSGKFGVDELDLILPIFTILQFLFYIGWLKVAESLVNPFGDGDYDFELNWMIDRHLQVAYTIVDKIHYKTPPLQKDPYWEEMVPPELPHTVASIKSSHDAPSTSTEKIIVSSKETEIVAVPSLINLATIAKTNIKFKRAGAKGEKSKGLLKVKSDAIKEYDETTADLEDSEDEIKIVTEKN